MLEAFDRSAPPDKIFSALERDGGVIVEGFLDAARTDRLARDFAPHLDAVDWCNSADVLGAEFFGRRTKRLHGLPGRSPLVAEVLIDPLLLAMCDRFLSPRCRDYRVSTGELMALGQGEAEQALHRDADSWRHFPQPRPEILVSANVALTDFTEENGATVVVPGSHRWPAGRAPADEPRARAVMSRGSALLYSGDVWHGGGANRTPETRIGMYFGYLLSWLRPLENHLITSGEAALRAAPERARELLDYSDAGWNVFP